MAPTLYWNGTNITDHVVSYRRDDNLCNSTSMIEVVLSGDCPHVFDFYDELVLYEDGNKKGTYSINNKSEATPAYTINITATNSQINLENHFITEKYYIVDTPLLKTRYWIEKFLTESDVNYNFTATGDGEFLPEDTVLGGNLAIDEIRRLLQYSGWYLRYDENGTAQVGNLEYSTDYYSRSITDSTILAITTQENDSFLRNRAVVWGMGSLDSDSNGWIYADISTQTPWNYDSNDKRAVVLSNSYIADYGTALSIAYKLLTEFTKPTYIKTVKVAGFVNTFVGDRVRLNSKYIGAICTVTTMGVEFGSNGSITTLTLDERCPRMIGYFNYGGYVYAGTEDYGIWRKPLKYVTTWEQDSVGLGNIHVSDLSIHAGLFSCVAEDELYIRSPETVTWTKITPYILESGVVVNNSICTGTTVHRGRNVVQSLYTYANSYSGVGFNPYITIDNPRSWLVETTPGAISITYPIIASGTSKYVALSLDNDGKDTYISTIAVASGTGTGTTENGWTSFLTAPPSGWCWREFGYDSFGELRDNGTLALTNVHVASYDKQPDNYLDYKTTFPDNIYDYGVSVGLPSTKDLHAEWIMYDLGFVITADSTFKVITEQVIGSEWCYSLFFEFYFKENAQPNPADFYVNFNNGTTFPEDSGTVLSSAVGFARNAYTTGSNVMEFKFAPSMVGKTIAAVTWTSDILQSLTLTNFDPISTILSKIAFTNVTLDTTKTWINQGTYSSGGGSGTVDRILKFNGRDFESVGYTATLLNVESSRASPVTLYGGYQTLNGAQLYTNNSGPFVQWMLPYEYYIQDLRVTEMLLGGALKRYLMFISAPTGSGYSRVRTLDLDATVDEISLADFTPALSSGVLISGYFNHLETTNTQDIPYIFYSMSGIPPRFYQLTGGNYGAISISDFEEHSTGLPNSNITCIRTDDLI